MTDSKALQDLIRKIDELSATLEAHTVEIHKQLERLDYLYNTLDTDLYILKSTVDGMEKDK
jgi:uncharacterized coiled-coil protein SlyX